MKKILVLSLSLMLLCCWIAAYAAPTKNNQNPLVTNNPIVTKSIEKQAVQPVLSQAPKSNVERVAADKAVKDENSNAPVPPPDPNVILQGGDDFASATVIGALPYMDNGTTTGMTPNYTVCGYTVAPDVVYSYTPASNISIKVTLCTGTTWDTAIGVNTDPTTQIACNDDFCGLVSELSSVSLTGGVTYYIIIKGYSTYNGPYQINVTEVVALTPDVSVTLPAELPYSNTNTNCGLGNRQSTTCLGSYDGGEDITYQVTLTAPLSLNIVLDPGASDYTGMAISDAFPLGATCIATSTNSGVGAHGFYGLSLAAGTYYIMIDTWPTPNCIPSFTLSIQENTTIPPPNDACADVTPVGITVNVPTTVTGTTDGATSNDCATFPGYPLVWEAFTTTEAMDITIDMCGSGSQYGLMYFYLTTDCACTAIIPNNGYNWTTCADLNPTWVFYNVPAGTYYVPIIYDPANGNQGPYQMTFLGTPPPGPPANDACATAEAIGDVTGLAWSTLAATADGIGTCITTPDIWYVYTASTTGLIRASLCGSAFDTKLAVYDGNSCSPLPTELGCNDDFCGLQSQLDFQGVLGEEYLIQVGGYSGSGTGVLTVGPPPPPPPNDLCTDVTPVPLPLGSTLTFNGTTVNSNNDCALLGTYNQVWEAFTISSPANVTVDFCTTVGFTNYYWVLVQGCPCGSYILRTNYDYTTCGDGQITFWFDNLPSGTYYLPVLGLAGSADGPYTVHISAAASPQPVFGVDPTSITATVDPG